MKFDKMIGMVEEFHTAFKLKNGNHPTNIPEEKYRLRHRLMEEENNEYLQAAKDDNLVEIADALGDQLYVLIGTILKHGLQDKIEDIFQEIHTSNMSKLDDNGNPIYREDGKVIKSKNYFKPNLSQFLQTESEKE